MGRRWLLSLVLVLGCGSGGGSPSPGATTGDGPLPTPDAPADGRATDTRALAPPADASLCPSSIPENGSAPCPLPSINDRCTYPGTPGCTQICSCAYPNGYWFCRSSCPGLPATCPVVLPRHGDSCGTEGACFWDQGCSRTECRCMPFELGSPMNWSCYTSPNPDGGAPRNTGDAASSCGGGGADR
jgi:hypothetical protein